MISLLGEKFTFFNSLGTNEISRIFRLSFCIHVFLLINFSEQFELYFYLKYSKAMTTFHNLDDQRFETDFSSTKMWLEIVKKRYKELCDNISRSSLLC